MKKFLAQTPSPLITIDTGIANIGTLNISSILSFFIKLFFAVAALSALLYLLLGALAWVTSGGSKESVEKAREKIQAAVIGIVLIVAVIAIAVTLEQFVFQKAICFGLSCEIKIPGLISPNSQS